MSAGDEAAQAVAALCLKAVSDEPGVTAVLGRRPDGALMLMLETLDAMLAAPGPTRDRTVTVMHLRNLRHLVQGVAERRGLDARQGAHLRRGASGNGV